MYPKGIINIYSINANKVFSKIPGDIFNVSVIAIKKIHEKKTSVYTNSFEAYSSVLFHEAAIDSNTLLSSNMICAPNRANLAVRYIPGIIKRRKPKAETIPIIIFAPNNGKNFDKPACKALIGLIVFPESMAI